MQEWKLYKATMVTPIAQWKNNAIHFDEGKKQSTQDLYARYGYVRQLEIVVRTNWWCIKVTLLFRMLIINVGTIYCIIQSLCFHLIAAQCVYSTTLQMSWIISLGYLITVFNTKQQRNKRLYESRASLKLPPITVRHLAEPPSCVTSRRARHIRTIGWPLQAFSARLNSRITWAA